MPIPLLLAMVLAFGLGLPTEARSLSNSDLIRRLVETGLGVVLVGAVGTAFGMVVALRVKRSGGAQARTRGVFVWGLRTVVGLGLTVFAWTLCWIDWPRVVDWGLGLRGTIFIEEFAVLMPYLAGQFLAWCGLYAAERALRPGIADRGMAAYLFRKSRQSFGMVLPVASIYVLGRDVLRWKMPQGFEDPTIQFGGTCLIAALVFILSPAFVRLTWPTRRMEAGPLRDRLERLSRRLRFRCSDILVWDTGGVIVNAGVTGSVPWFRYVLITDAMIELLDEHEIEAVFGHEVGHIAHRHLPYFGLFLLGSMGLLTMCGALVARIWNIDASLARWLPEATLGTVEQVLLLAICGLYFFVVFGFLSRRFERQADVFGARAVSCDQHECPPHRDMNAPDAPDRAVRTLCPVGIRIFANALGNVAALNGMSPRARSWRHGSIAKRIAFLEGLEYQPDAEKKFQLRIARLRWALVVGLATASAIAVFLASGEAGAR
ncbi:MAG: Zn-dependent protease with chaperone function [Planctomycetota bacterium]|nr:Zn-dependent protease with chaperone function [Planctomycetota bacterium]